MSGKQNQRPDDLVLVIGLRKLYIIHVPVLLKFAKWNPNIAAYATVVVV
jgi:hypothetical protein